jgi:heme/copper-type cytochrome/quinol oxidase subunit 4
MTLTWFGWLYLTIAITGIAVQIAGAGKARVAISGWTLVLSLAIQVPVQLGVFFIGVTS